MYPPDFPRPEVPPALGDRSLFPTLAWRVYANHAAVSPASSPVIAAAGAALADVAAHGAGAFPRWIAQRNRLRGKLASLVGAGAEDVGYAPNTTTGVLHLAMSVPWRPGDRVVLFEGEFPANVTPWQRAADTFGLEPVFLPLDGVVHGTFLERVEATLRRGARLVAVSAVQFQTGLLMPLRDLGDLCHRYGAELFVDGIQAVGVVPIDVSTVDYLACGSHKWLMGLEGAAFVVVAPEAMRRLVPRVAGWLSHEDGLGFLFHGSGHLRYDRPIRSRADRLELGAQNTVGYAGLEAAVDVAGALGVPAVYAHVNRWNDALERALGDRGFHSERATSPAHRSGTLALRAPDGVDPVDLQAALGARGVACSLPDGRLRFSPHWPNALEEVPWVVDAVDEALAEARRRGPCLRPG